MVKFFSVTFDNPLVEKIVCKDSKKGSKMMIYICKKKSTSDKVKINFTY